MPLPGRVRRALLLRSFAVQGSWNYETLIGTGFAFVLLPALRYVYRADPDGLRAAVQRHATLFNSHPYLVTLAAGAVARLEAEGTSPEVVGRFKNAVRSSLGSLGDQVVWLAWRPASALVAIALLLLGAPWWLAVAVFLAVYNALHLWVRLWGLRLGLREGLGVAHALRQAMLTWWGRRAADAGALLAGFCVVLAIGRAGPGAAGIGGAVLAAVLGLWLGLNIRRGVYAALVAAWVVGLITGAFS